MRSSFALGATVAGVAAVWSMGLCTPETLARTLRSARIASPQRARAGHGEPQKRKMIAAPINPNWRDFPKTGDEWKKQVDAAAAAVFKLFLPWASNCTSRASQPPSMGWAPS